MTKNLLSILAFCFLLSSCGNKSTEEKTSAKDVKKEVEEAMDVTRDFLSQEYDNVLTSFDELKKDAQKKIDEIKKETGALGDEIKESWDAKIKSLEGKISQLEEKMEEHKNATGKKKDDLEKEIKKLKEAIQKSIATFKTEIREE